MSQPDSAATPLGERSALPPLQQRVAEGIVEAAARAIAARGEQASMSDIASEAGVARATLYRYFPGRAVLLHELARVAARDARERLVSARIDEVGAREGVVRTVRALLDVGDAFVALARESVRPDPEQFEEAIVEPLRRLVERGQSTGELRADVPAAWLTEALLALVVAVLAAGPVLGREDAVAAISSLYLDGSHTRPSAIQSGQ
jgi:TetR/AcrR family transcriptional regulator, mexCD-oprJ operon repressor